MDMGIVLIVSLHIHPGQETAFRRFETAAARIMARHGGRIERVIRPISGPGDAALPHEIHLVSFPGHEQFAAYRADAELLALAPLRAAAIARTAITIGVPGEPYGPGDDGGSPAGRERD
jgi:uncharacterized protein (DUF1330 family)